MELIGLNKDMNIHKYLKFIELQWTRKFYEAGEFSVQLLSSEYDPEITFVIRSDRPELGLVQKVEYSESTNGAFVQLSGFFAEKLLDEKITYPTYSTGGISAGAFWLDIWNKYIKNTDIAAEYNLTISPQAYNSINSASTTIAKMTTGDAIGTMLNEVFEPQNIGVNASFDYINKAVCFNISKGRDLTQDNSEGNNFVIFSENFGNLINAAYTADSSAYKNYAIVQGEGEGSARETVAVDLSNGSSKRILYVDARDLKQEEGITLAQYRNQLHERGIEKLSECVSIENIEVDTTIHNGFEYLSDYDLGDYVDIVINSISRSFKAQIREVDEVVSGVNNNISLVFGDPIPTVWKKARIR